jgi:hypothetical protein
MALQTLFEDLEKAIELARNSDSSITLLYVAVLPPVYVIGHPLDKVKKSLVKKARKFIKEAEGRCTNQNISYATKIFMVLTHHTTLKNLQVNTNTI